MIYSILFWRNNVSRETSNGQPASGCFSKQRNDKLVGVFSDVCGGVRTANIPLARTYYIRFMIYVVKRLREPTNFFLFVSIV